MTSPPPLKRKSHNGKIKWVLEYEVITPMMGGGAKTRESDPIATVRATSVLGQLRFWWRACRAGDFSDLRQLRAAEDALWGTMSSPSKVELSLECTQAGHLLDGFDFRDTNAPTYAAFPLQGDRRGTPPGKIRKGIQFTLTLRFPEKYKEDIEAALWAWTHFGGIGARTRRGFGALHHRGGEKFELWSGDNHQQLVGNLRQLWARHVSGASVSNALKQVPRLPLQIEEATVAIGATVGVSDQVWKRVVNCLRDIRQKRREGTERNRPGRSYWPEPDTIRKLTGQAAALHRRPVTDVEGFPRAFYGLPIIFHFKDQRDGDPGDTSLETKNYGRRASPLILKPIALKSGKCLALALLLSPNGLPPSELILKGGGQRRVDQFQQWDKLASELLKLEFGRKGPFFPILNAVRSL